jgi:hypothetical protein
MNSAAKEGACGNDDAAARETTTFECLDSFDRRAIVTHQQTRNSALDCLHALVLFDHRSHGTPIQSAITLSAWRPHSWTLAAIQHAELERREICRASHDSTERIYLAHDGSLRDTADCRIARHLADCLERARNESNGRTCTSGGDRGFGAGVTGPYDDDVKMCFSGKRLTSSGHTLKLMTLRNESQRAMERTQNAIVSFFRIADPVHPKGCI